MLPGQHSIIIHDREFPYPSGVKLTQLAPSSQCDNQWWIQIRRGVGDHPDPGIRWWWGGWGRRGVLSKIIFLGPTGLSEPSPRSATDNCPDSVLASWLSLILVVSLIQVFFSSWPFQCFSAWGEMGGGGCSYERDGDALRKI